jgi:FtsZ-binding cell division protein ZapB
MQGLQECLNQTRNDHLEEKQSSMDRARELEFENKTLKAENSSLNDKIKSFQERTKMEILNLENQNSMKSSSLQEKVDSYESEIKRLKNELDLKSKELIKKSQEVLNNQAFVDQEIELLKKKNDMFQNREKDLSMDKESLIRETKNLQDQILT